LSPLNSFIHFFGSYISLATIVLVQAAFLILLGNVAFDLAIQDSMFAKLFVITAIIITLFVLLGIAIGYLFKFQLVTVLISIGISIIMLLYSNILRSEEMMTAVARSIAGFNPFLIGSKATTKIVLFNLPLKTVFSEFTVVFVEILLLCIVIFLIWVLKRKE